MPKENTNAVKRYKFEDKKIAAILKDKEDLVEKASKLNKKIEKSKKELKKLGFKVERMKEKLQPLMKKAIKRENVKVNEPLEIPHNVEIEKGKVCIDVLDRVEDFKEHLISQYKEQKEEDKKNNDK